MFTCVKKVRVLLTELVKLRVGAKAGQCLIQAEILRACRSGGGIACCEAPSMPSLRQLLAAHPTLLVVDTCATRSDAALWVREPGNGSTSPHPVLAASFHAAVEGEAAHALPQAVAQVLSAAGLGIARLDAVAFCAGPGSVLGIRLAAASVRVWRVVRPGLPLYSYLSLPLLATHPDALNTAVIADARRDTWHAVRPGASIIERIPGNSLAAAGPLTTPASFRRWSPLPVENPPRELPYHPATLLAATPDSDLFADAPGPDAFAHEQPSYVTWTPQVHQAPLPSSPT
jgi:tRNA threonylcarbamoyladenosine biosynthesis protein TsaB